MGRKGWDEGTSIEKENLALFGYIRLTIGGPLANPTQRCAVWPAQVLQNLNMNAFVWC